METKDGKEFVTFTIGDPAGFAADKETNWKPVSRRRKTPSQLRRDQRRKENFTKKKILAAAQEAPEHNVKIEAGTPAKATLAEPVDEINLENVNEKARNVFKIKGEFKDPKRKPWFEIMKTDKENEHEAFWELIKISKDKIGFDDFSDASTYIEHYLEFWGDMVVKPGVTEEYLKNLENWPKGVRNLEIR